MGQAIVDPQELRRFAARLRHFSGEVMAQMQTVQRQLSALGATWRDGEHQKFSEELEQQLNQLLQNRGLIRLKGRLWLEGKARPLQIQAVGPRLECWFETGSPEPAGDQPAPPGGLDLVVLGFQLDQAAIEATLLEATGAA